MPRAGSKESAGSGDAYQSCFGDHVVSLRMTVDRETGQLLATVEKMRTAAVRAAGLLIELLLTLFPPDVLLS